jgi:hypothetical protein
MGSAADWASVVVTLVLGIAGFVLANHINRDVRLRLAERRLAAYARLWEVMRRASPYDPPLDTAARQRLRDHLTDWYYAHGDGMLLERVSRSVYLEAKDNLTRPLEQLTPVYSRERLHQLPVEQLDTARGVLAQRQLSLLRTQLKSDLAIFGRPYGPQLGPEDRAFLTACGVNLRCKPWSDAGSGPASSIRRRHRGRCWVPGHGVM